MKAFTRTAHDITVSRALRATGNLRALLCALALFAPGLAGCSQQGEGERCDPANLNGDCDTGLSCVSLSALHRGTVGAVCCPDANATADVCLQVDFSGDESSTPEATEPAPETEPASSTESGGTVASDTESNSQPTAADAGNMSDAGSTSAAVVVDGGR
jgi:hypothetical protein